MSALRDAKLRAFVARLDAVEPDSAAARAVYAEAAAAGLVEALQAELRNLARIDIEDAAALTQSHPTPRVRAVR